MKRVLITGSRACRDREAVWQTLEHFRKALGPIVVVHGDCPTGVDHFAHQWAVLYNIAEERYPANWRLNGKGAGHIRNQQMVDLGADVCLAFPHPDSRGTFDCARRAEAAAIPTHRFPHEVES